jgi:hypothetical protein
VAQFWTEDALAPQLSEGEKQLRDRFVNEYMVDFDQKAAAIRVGFLPSFAEQYASVFMQESYVQQKIAEKQKESATDEKVESEETKRRIRAALLRESNYRGPGSSHAARVGALGKLTQIYGMEAPIKTLQELTHKGGVMMVPAIASIEDWEKAAQLIQEKLRRDSEVSG